MRESGTRPGEGRKGKARAEFDGFSLLEAYECGDRGAAPKSRSAGLLV